MGSAVHCCLLSVINKISDILSANDSIIQRVYKSMVSQASFATMSTTVDAIKGVRVCYLGRYCALGLECPLCDENVSDFVGRLCGRVPTNFHIDRLLLNGRIFDEGQFKNRQVKDLPDDPDHGVPYFVILTSTY